MTDILFITPNLHATVKHEINGTLILGSLLLADGFDVSVLRYCEIDGYQKNYTHFIENLLAQILDKKPKCVSFYTIWNTYHIILRLCNEIKKRDSSIKTILGGPQSSALAEETLQAFPSVDFICTGEGENTTVPFFRRLLREEGAEFKDVPGLYYRYNGQIFHSPIPVPLTDMEDLPFWDDRLLMKEYTSSIERGDPSKYFMPVEVGRGCPYNCTFCCTSVFWKRNYRLKSPQRIMKDIRFFHDRFGHTSFLLSHDALTANQELIDELCNQIIDSGLNITWECATRVDCVSPDLIDKMIKSGLKNIHMGIETGSDRMQKLTNKNLDIAKTKEMVKTLVDKKLRVILFFVYAIPEETDEDFNKTLELMFDFCDMGVQDVRLSTCMFAPGSALTTQYYDQLVFQPEYQAVAMSRFGCQEETEMIRQNKALFACFYHCPSTLSEKYPHAKHLSLLYQRFPKTARFVRHFYNGDYLRLYRDFHNNNPEIVSLDIPELEEAINKDSLQIMLNTIRNIDAPKIEQVRELLRFESDIQKIAASNNQEQWNKTYGFRYLEYAKGLSIDQFSEGTTQFLLTKTNKVSVRPIKFT